MIPIRTIAEVLPRSEPPEVPLNERIIAVIGENETLRNLAKWCEAIRREVSRRFPEGRFLRETIVKHNGPAGIGLIDVPTNWKAGFPSLDGVAVGLVLYTPAGYPSEDFGFGEPASLQLADAGGLAVPVLFQPATFTQNCHPSGGRASAIVSDGNGQYVLTARHVVDKKMIGAPVALTNPHCHHWHPFGHCSGTVAKKGHLYLDVALVRLDHSCHCGGSSPVSTAVGAQGTTVRHYFASTGGAVQASVLQEIATPASFVNGAAPLTFLTDIAGQPGDSGSPVTTDMFGSNAATRDLVGSYSGTVAVQCDDGVMRQRGFAHDADEAMRLFGVTLQEGLYQ